MEYIDWQCPQETASFLRDLANNPIYAHVAIRLHFGQGRVQRVQVKTILSPKQLASPREPRLGLLVLNNNNFDPLANQSGELW